MEVSNKMKTLSKAQFATQLQPLFIPEMDEIDVFFAEFPYLGAKAHLKRLYKCQMTFREKCSLADYSHTDSVTGRLVYEIQQIMIDCSGYQKLFLISGDEVAAVGILIDYSGLIMAECFIEIERKYKITLDIHSLTSIDDIVRQALAETPPVPSPTYTTPVDS